MATAPGTKTPARRRSKTAQLEARVEELERREYNTRSLLNIIRALNSTLDFDRLLEIFVLTAFGHFACARAAIFIARDPSNNEWQVGYEMGFDDLNERRIVDELVESVRSNLDGPICVVDMKGKLQSRLAELGAAVVAPLRSKDDEVGFILLGPREIDPDYQPEDLEFLDQLCDQLSLLVHNAQQYEMATRDPLVKLFRRHMFDGKLDAMFRSATREGRVFGLIMMDLDHFKKVNDEHGHPVGDEVLRQIAKIIRKHCRDYDFPARYGGEEFSLILPGSDLSMTEAAAERIRKTIEDYTFKIGSIELKKTMSLGYACYDFAELGAMTPKAFLSAVDAALYRAKSSGRNKSMAVDWTLDSSEE